MTLCHNLVNQVSQHNNYKITHVNITKFLGRKVLKTTERSTITKVSSSAVKISKPATVSETGIIASFDMTSLSSAAMCPKCQEIVQEDDGLILCDSCNIVTSVTYANNTSSAKFVLKTENSQLMRNNSTTGKIGSISATNQMAFLKQIIQMKVAVEYAPSNNSVHNIKRVVVQPTTSTNATKPTSSTKTTNTLPKSNHMI